MEFEFESNLFGRSSRFFGGEQRVTAFKALVAGCLIHNHPEALMRAFRFTAAACVATTNSTEKQQMQCALDPCQIILNVLYCNDNGYIKVDFI